MVCNYGGKEQFLQSVAHPWSNVFILRELGRELIPESLLRIGQYVHVCKACRRNPCLQRAAKEEFIVLMELAEAWILSFPYCAQKYILWGGWIYLRSSYFLRANAAITRPLQILQLPRKWKFWTVLLVFYKVGKENIFSQVDLAFEFQATIPTFSKVYNCAQSCCNKTLIGKQGVSEI